MNPVCLTPEFQAVCAKEGIACSCAGRDYNEVELAGICTKAALLVRTYSANPDATRREQRQAARAQRQAYCQQLSSEFGTTITPSDVWPGIIAGIVMFILGGVPALILAVAAVVFEHWLEGRFYSAAALDSWAASVGVA